MSKAEEKAVRAYTDHEGFTFKEERKAFLKGYEQAEKDLALTVEDLKELIEEIIPFVDSDTLEREIPWASQKYYEELLNKFNEWRNKK